MRLIGPILLLLLACSASGPARGEGAISGGVTLRGVLEMDHINPEILWDPARQKWNLDEYGQPVLDSQYPLLWTWVRGWWAPWDWMTLHGTLDPGVLQYRAASTTTDTVLFGEVPLKEYRYEWTLDGMSPRNSLAATGLMREAALHLDLGPDGFLEFSGGKERVRIGDGWIYDDWGFSARVRARLSRIGARPVTPSIGVIFPYRYWNKLDSIGTRLMALTAGLEWRPTPFDGLTLEIAWLRDRAQQVGALLTNVLVADELSKGHPLIALEFYGAEPPMEADILWLRLSGQALLWEMIITGTVIFQYGEAYLDPKDPAYADKRIKMPAFAGGLDATLPLADGRWIPGLFLVAVQGIEGELDLKPTSVTLPVFVSLVPYLPHMALLFSGGLDAALASRQTTLMGLDGRGILATGATVTWRPTERLDAHLVIAPAWTLGRSPWTGNRFVGVEVDVRATIDLGAGFSLEVENDILTRGRYHREDALIWRFLSGIAWRHE